MDGFPSDNLYHYLYPFREGLSSNSMPQTCKTILFGPALRSEHVHAQPSIRAAVLSKLCDPHGVPPGSEVSTRTVPHVVVDAEESSTNAGQQAHLKPTATHMGHSDDSRVMTVQVAQ